jgi:two-component system phosphate regulon response regulator OmpR
MVLDVMMPGDDGLAVVRRLRAQGETVPVIMLTARGEDVDRILGLEMVRTTTCPSRSTRAS